MNQSLQTIIEKLVAQFGLQQYELAHTSFHKERIFTGEIQAKCSLEFFPHATKDQAEEDFNPPGTAAIEYNLTTEKIDNITFVDQTTFSTATLFPTQSVQEVAQWVEELTGLSYGQDFVATDTLDNGYQFKADFKGYEMSPSGLIEIEFTNDGQLLSFFNFDSAPLKLVNEATFTLTLEDVSSLIAQQIEFFNFPNEHTASFMPIYALNETYITNDGQKCIPFMAHEREMKMVHKVLKWDEALTGDIERHQIDLHSDIPLEEALNYQPVVEDLTVTEEEVAKITEITTDVLRTVCPDDTNKWELASIRKDQHFVEVYCKWIDQNEVFFNRKFVILLDYDEYRVLNYIDNGELYEIFDDFKRPEKAVVTHQEAVERLLPTLTLTPTYVYQRETGRFELCGLVDSNMAVDAVTGELLMLDEV